MAVGVLASSINGETLCSCSSTAVDAAIGLGPIIFAYKNWRHGEGVTECDDLVDCPWETVTIDQFGKLGLVDQLIYRKGKTLGKRFGREQGDFLGSIRLSR